MNHTGDNEQLDEAARRGETSRRGAAAGGAASRRSRAGPRQIQHRPVRDRPDQPHDYQERRSAPGRPARRRAASYPSRRAASYPIGDGSPHPHRMAAARDPADLRRAARQLRSPADRGLGARVRAQHPLPPVSHGQAPPQAGRRSAAPSLPADRARDGLPVPAMNAYQSAAARGGSWITPGRSSGRPPGWLMFQTERMSQAERSSSGQRCAAR